VCVWCLYECVYTCVCVACVCGVYVCVVSMSVGLGLGKETSKGDCSQI